MEWIIMMVGVIVFFGTLFGIHSEIIEIRKLVKSIEEAKYERFHD